MKNKLFTHRCAWLAVALLLAGAFSSLAGQEPTAFQIAKDGNQFVGDPSRDKVLEIYSDKSIAGITPSIWTVAYYDPDASFKVVEVKFGGGLKLDVQRPWKLFGGGGSLANVIDLNQLAVDSDGAIKIATSLQLLSPFNLKHTQLCLKRSADGLAWRVRLWAARLGRPDDVVEIGDVFISPVDGKILRADLHIDRLN